MKWFKNLNIRNKLILIILMVSFVIVTLFGGVRIVWDMQQARSSMSQDISSLLQLLGNRSTAALAFNDERLARENLTSLQNISHVMQACLYREDTSVLATYRRDGTVKKSCPSADVLVQMQIKFEDNNVHAVSVVKQKQQAVGWLYIRSDLSLINSRLNDQLLFSALALLATVVLAWVLANWTQRLISNPIQEMTEVAVAIEEQGDLSLRAQVSNHDEVGKLAQSFNAMLDALNMQNQQLEASKIEQQLASVRYRSLVESTSAIPWEVDLNTWCFTYVGQQAQAILGYRLEDWYQENFLSEHLHPEDREACLSFCQTAAAEKRDHQLEYRMQTAKGNYIWIHEDVQVICENDKPVRMQGFMFDITERKRHEEAITNIAAGVSSETGDDFFRHLVEHLAQLFNADYAFIGVLDEKNSHQINTLSVYANGRIAENMSYSLKDTPCANVIDQKTCAYPSGVQQLFPQDQLLIDMGVDGYIGSPLYDSKGEPLGLLVVMDSQPLTDIEQVSELLEIFAARAAAEVERMHAEDLVRKLSQVVEQNPNMVVITDINGTIEYVNPVFTQITGYSEADVLGENSRIFQSGKTSLEVYQGLWGSVKQGKVWQGELVNRRKNGELYTEEEIIAPLMDSSGKITHFVSIKQDVTERRLTEEALRRSQKMDAIGQLSGGIAHDFNNQLGVVIGYLDMLKASIGDDEKANKWVDTASRASLRCVDLTRQLLNFSRRKSIEKTCVDINEKLKELENMVKRSITPEVEVQYSLADDLWHTDINSGEFQDAILNLVINARDAMPNGGKLLFETRNQYLDESFCGHNTGIVAGDYVQLILSDTGEGMDKETTEHIFEPFFTTKAEGKGTGLGMAMVYGFLKRYGGNINVYSEQGVGTTFKLYLPRSKNKKLDITQNKNHIDELAGGNETILIVDDEKDLLELADEYLSDLGYRTCLANNAAQALEILAADKTINLLFSDVVMPGGMNGYDLAQQAVKHQPKLKVLLTSGFTARGVTENGLAKFSNRLLSKPYRKAELAQRIRLVLDETLSKK